MSQGHLRLAGILDLADAKEGAPRSRRLHVGAGAVRSSSPETRAPQRARSWHRLVARLHGAFPGPATRRGHDVGRGRQGAWPSACSFAGTYSAELRCLLSQGLGRQGDADELPDWVVPVIESRKNVRHLSGRADQYIEKGNSLRPFVRPPLPTLTPRGDVILYHHERRPSP
jgi:hypothetical protein